MNRMTAVILSSTLLLGAVACSNAAKTNADAPNSTDKTGEVPPKTDTVQSGQNDAGSQVRRDQLNSDIRAREQRNDVTGGDGDRANADLSSEVRSKLEANIPNSNLTVAAKDGNVVVSGTVQAQSQYDKIESLAKQIKGVKSVNVAAKVAPAVSDKQ